jgi:hypothetical protein
MEHAWIDFSYMLLAIPCRSPRARVLRKPLRLTHGSPLRPRRDISPVHPDAAHSHRDRGIRVGEDLA